MYELYNINNFVFKNKLIIKINTNCINIFLFEKNNINRKDVISIMNVSKTQYLNMTGKSSPASPIWKDLFLAFIFGGFICTIGQFLTQIYMNYFELDKKVASAWVSITLIIISSLLTALNWYGKIAKHAGAGTIVPITGFSNSITAPAIEFKSEGFVFGVGAKMFIMAGPVIVYGTIASILYGMIIWIFKLY